MPLVLLLRIAHATLLMSVSVAEVNVIPELEWVCGHYTPLQSVIADENDRQAAPLLSWA